MNDHVRLANEHQQIARRACEVVVRFVHAKPFKFPIESVALYLIRYLPVLTENGRSGALNRRS